MARNLFCTYFDSNYLNRGLSLIESLDRSNNGQFSLVVVCVDELTKIALEKLNYPQVTTIALSELEYRDRKLLACKTDRSATEYMWTLTPTVIRYIYNSFPSYDHITYIDADLYFWGSESEILKELGDNKVLIHGHDFPPRFEHLAAHGIYNVGLISFARCNTSAKILGWWRERCIEWCYKRVEDGKFGDQGYLNQWPEIFEGIRVNQNIGIGVAPWNHENYNFSQTEAGVPLVNGQKVVFFHYHGIRLISDGVILPCDQAVYDIVPPVYQCAYLPYLHSLARSELKIAQVFEHRRFGYQYEQHELQANESLLIRSDKVAEFWSLAVPHEQIRLDEDWCLALNPFVAQAMRNQGIPNNV